MTRAALKTFVFSETPLLMRGARASNRKCDGWRRGSVRRGSPLGLQTLPPPTKPMKDSAGLAGTSAAEPVAVCFNEMPSIKNRLTVCCALYRCCYGKRLLRRDFLATEISNVS